MKTVEEIYEEMMAVFRRETGAEGTAASDLSVKLYAVAAQIYGLYAQAEWLARQCFPQTARGEYLDRHAAIRGLERRGAVAAGGVIRFSLEAPPGRYAPRRGRSALRPSGREYYRRERRRWRSLPGR